MRRFKRITGVCLAAGMAAGLISGCGGGTAAKTTTSAAATTKAETASQSSQSGNSSDKVTLRMAWWGGDARHKALLATIDAYTAKHPNVSIEAEYQGYDGYYEKMMTELSSGTAPDIFQFHANWVPDVQGADHYLADLSKFPVVDYSQLPETIIEGSDTYKGERVLYSCSEGGQVMYVNTDVASKFGIDLTKNYTWDEWLQLGKSIHEQDPDTYLMTADIDVLNRLILPIAVSQQTGTSMVDADYKMTFSEEQLTKALQLIADLYDTGTCEPYGDASVFVGQMDQNNKWINGQIGVLLDIVGGYAKYKASITSELGAMAIPRFEGAKCSGVDFSGDMGYSINDKSKNKEVAADFLNYMFNDPEANSILLTNLGYPASKEAQSTLAAAGKIDKVQQDAAAISEKDAIKYTSASNNTDLETIRKNDLQEMIYGEMTPEETAKDIIEQYTDTLNQMKSAK